ncbi:lipopolysaccharide export system permease protein [Lewinella aquimaris]|uniref:Lipopolysaccharide export system permease protein n=1 Tax=Neolewinella aquimaris TaxID=1835722 RepID=A0A840E8A5_9BACT|nr:LptF/LptG family permease [Neolewinella aquimaris]MBB4079537.1 lipopolysaccharide export system permease protein [Neolewinella aquimaris]
MLKKLDWYIIGKFLRTFFFTVLIFSMVSMIIDFSEKVERFIESDITKEIIAFEYFPTFLLFILGFLWPMLTLIAVIFFTGRMADNSEIISILNAGVSFWRLMRPYLISAGFLFLLYLAGIHYLVPMANAHRTEIERVYFSSGRDEGKTTNVHFFVAPDTKVYMTHYSKRDSAARNFRIEHLVDNQLISLTKARSAKFVDGDPAIWRLDNYEMRTFDGLHETITIGGRETLDTVLNLRPEDFVDYREQQSALTTPELLSQIRKQRERGAGNIRKYEVELARRSAEPFTIFILTLIGLSVAGRKVRGGMGIQLALGIFMGALFVFLSRFASTISAGTNLPVFLGMWMPNLIFFAAAMFFVSRAQR